MQAYSDPRREPAQVPAGSCADAEAIYRPSEAYIDALRRLVALAMESGRILAKAYPDRGYLGESLLDAAVEIAPWVLFSEAHRDFPPQEPRKIDHAKIADLSDSCRVAIREDSTDTAYRQARELYRLALGRLSHAR